MVPLTERLNLALCDRYAVEREIGRGGMAVVYLAEDLKHARRVAIKVLLPELAASIGAERFLREIETVSRLVHPRILPIFDSGDADGLLYYVMPYVEGDSLRDRLESEKQLPLDEAIGIAEQVADVLGYAHEEGIVHRDIKPGNILFEAGHAVVADFGIARAIARAGGQGLTQTGIAMGTPAYMSPEQASGEEQIDGRADLYSLACVLYEMLAGEPPYTGVTAQVILARKATEPIPSLRTVRETIPDGIEAVVARALAKVPADRYRTTREFAEVLRNPPRSLAGGTRRSRAIGMALGLAIVAAGWVAVQARGPTELPVVAVLPCENLNSDSTRIPSADRWTNDIITDLFKTSRISPRGWSTMREYREAEANPAEIASELQADYFLTCVVNETDGSVTLNGEFVRAQDETLVWTDNLQAEASVAGMVGLRSRIVQAIASAAGASISDEELRSLDALPTTSDSAYKLYLRGKDLVEASLGGDMGPEALTMSLGLFDQAIALDSIFALAYEEKAFTLDFHGQIAGLRPGDYYPETKRLLVKALDLDKSLGRATMMLGNVLAIDSRDWVLAEDFMKRGIELVPNDAFAHTYYAQALSNAGLHDQALREMREAVALEPTSSFHQNNLSFRYHFAGRYEEALHEAQRALEQDTGALSWLTVAVNLAALGRHDEAVSAMESIPANPFTAGMLGWVYAVAGRQEEATRLVEELELKAEASYSDAVDIAMIHVGLGNHDDAIEWLRRAYDERSIYLTTVFGHNEWFPFNPLRGDPRFQDLKTRVGFGSG